MILDHAFSLGFGKTMNYQNSCFISTGMIQYKKIGQDYTLKKESCNRIELILDTDDNSEIKKAVSKLMEFHPHQDPAYEYYRIER